MRALFPMTVIACLVAVGAQAGVLQVPLNHTERLRLAGSAASVVVGNPLVADVTVVDSQTIFVSGKSLGSTNVAVMDALGRTLFSAELLVGARGAAVTVFRGAEREEMACTSSCAPVAAGSGAPVMASAAPAAGGLPSSLLGLAGGPGPSALGDALAGAAGVAAAALPTR